MYAVHLGANGHYWISVPAFHSGLFRYLGVMGKLSYLVGPGALCQGLWGDNRSFSWPYPALPFRVTWLSCLCLTSAWLPFLNRPQTHLSALLVEALSDVQRAPLENHGVGLLLSQDLQKICCTVSFVQRRSVLPHMLCSFGLFHSVYT